MQTFLPVSAVLFLAMAGAAQAKQEFFASPPTNLPVTGAVSHPDDDVTPVQDTRSLRAWVAELERNNPELKAAEREVDMRVARIAPAGTPPDPTFSVGYMSGFLRPPFFPSTSTPDGSRQFGLSQELPYPGKLAFKSRIAAVEADIARSSAEEVRVRLIADLKSAYFDYVFVDRSLAIVRKNKELLEQFRQIAEARFSVGKGIQQDVLKAQLEISLLLERLGVLERQRVALQAEINRLLYRAPDTAVDAALAYQAMALTQSLDELRALAGQRSPALRRGERQIDRGQHALALAKKELLPDFAINFTTQRFVGAMPWMYGLDLMVKVPIFWQRKQRPMIAEAAAALESGKRMRENTLALAIAQVTEQSVAATTSKRLTDLYSDSVLPQARLALESSLAAYQVGTVDFLTLLTNFMTVLTYEITYEEQVARQHQALARLEPFVGLQLIK